LKYRPQTLDELDSVDVREYLKKIVSSKNIPHAFLFAGPKGMGKTSAARILAKIINCESKKPPCNKCKQCLSIMKGNNLDVIELDAASHRGIDDVRVLRDAVKLSPSSAKKKIYIIDEAHMLTTEASNALLKTLEEPPDHVVFILATTNPEKLIDTIKSRATTILFKKASDKEIIRSLERVIKAEKIKIDEETIALIAKTSGGSFRDATKILEQVVLEGKETLTQNKLFDVENFVEALIARKAKESLNQVQEFTQKGVQVDAILSETNNYLRNGLLGKSGIGEDNIPSLGKDELINLIELLIEAGKSIPDSPIEELPLEIAIVKWCGEDVNMDDIDKTKIDMGKKEEDPKPIVSSSKGIGKVSEVTSEVWSAILTKIHPVNTSIEALLRAAKPLGYDGKNLTLGVFYKFHKERLEDSRHMRILEEVVAGVLGAPTRVICRLTEAPAQKAVLTEGKDEDIIKVAEEIFGS
jgi:DNA polymerase-3 subunit gamma/tau